MTPDKRWEDYGITEAWLKEKAEWMSRDPGFKGTVILYFQNAGSLMRFCWFDYLLLSAVFFHAVVGLEGVLRIVYADQQTSFKSLLDRAVLEGTISDAIFFDIRALPKEFRDRIEKDRKTYSEKLASLLPALRNDYLHGGYLLTPIFLNLALHVREAVDAVWNRFSNGTVVANGTLPPRLTV